jgi:hypothetical protein
MRKKLIKILTIISIPVSTFYIFNAYKKPSKFELAATRLGFGNDKVNTELQHEALLKKFQLAGYFKPGKIWEDLNRIGQIKNPDKAFIEILKVIKTSGADQDDPKKFNAKYMRKNLFKNSSNIDLQDVMDLIVYMAQHAFNRKPGQERNELAVQEWMIKHKEFYIDQARILGLIDRKRPSKSVYDFAWVAGASRHEFLSRIVDFNYNLVKFNLKIVGETLLLAGNRELWANFDGLNPIIRKKLVEIFEKNLNIDDLEYSKTDFNINGKLSEGREYLAYLAKKFDVKLDSEMPLIQYRSENECPIGRFVNRIYLNYETNEECRITETLMAKDLLENDLKKKLIVNIIDTKAMVNTRPTTATTAKDATEACVEYIEKNKEFFGNKKEFSIVFETNNPHIERQLLTSQQEADRVLKIRGLDKEGYRFKIDGIGYACLHEDVATIHSEFGALVAEKWKVAVSCSDVKPKRDLKDLLYQSRNNSINVAALPTSTQIVLLYNFENCFFDSF